MSKRSERKAKLIALLFLAITCFAVSAQFYVPSVSAAETVDEAKQELQDLQNQLIEINKQLAAAKDAVSKAEAEASTRASRVNIVKQQIAALQTSIDLKTEELAAKQAILDAKQQEHDETYELFKQRLRAMYMSNDASVLSLILGASSFSEFLVTAETQARISRHDTELVERLEMEAEIIAAEQEIIKTELASLEEDMAALETKYSELAALYQEADAELSAAEALQHATQADYDAILADFNAVQKEWGEYMGNGMDVYVGGYYAWPVPGYSRISSKFGWRTLYGKPNYHTGIDIAGYEIYGKPVIASNTGQVVRVRYYTTGYGYHVMIDHGGNQWTVYAHLSGIAVKEGDWVAQGQTIGYVGSTGNSTGPHLHFEIRQNGVQVDPLTIVQRP